MISGSLNQWLIAGDFDGGGEADSEFVIAGDAGTAVLVTLLTTGLMRAGRGWERVAR